MRANIADDGTTYPSTRNYTISDGPHFLETDWAAASAPGANDGYITLWIDGVLQNTVSGVNNDTRRVEKVYFGPSSGLDAGTAGTEYSDAFESRRPTYIGPVSSGGLITATINYTYDPLYRLTNAAYSGAYTYTFAYVYDQVGNRTTQTRTITSTQVITYVYDNANRMTQAGGVNYTWDNNGNLTNDGSALYRYDQANRLISTTLGGTTSLFNYNGDGVRLRQVVAGVPTTYTQDLAAPLPVVLQARTGITTTKYLYSLGTRPLVQNTTAWEYLLPDALGSVRQIADANGNVTLAKSYEPYGSVLNSSGSATLIFAYAGEQIDISGLIYLRARYIQPTLGIFLTEDTIPGNAALPRSLHLFGYAWNNPVNLLDPNGRQVPPPQCKPGDICSTGTTGPYVGGTPWTLPPPPFTYSSYYRQTIIDKAHHYGIPPIIMAASVNLQSPGARMDPIVWMPYGTFIAFEQSFLGDPYLSGQRVAQEIAQRASGSRE